MMTSSRPRGNVGGSFANRRGHANQLSISDPSHHVTEAIGTMYGDEDDSGAEDNRPMSFVTPKYGSEQLTKSQAPAEPSGDRLRLVRTISDQSSPAQAGPPNGTGIKKTHTFPARMSSQRSSSFEGPNSPLQPLSPTPSLRESSQFPMTNIDNANDIAQELSNLQALRRMSMDVINHDPDLVPFSGMSLVAIPAIAPSGDDDEADPSRLLWVPARVHPELEPTAFKDFLENRVQTMKRRSGDSLLSASGSQRGGDAGGLRRKKSMLSRQINTHSGGDGYVDGAERLERNYPLNEYATPELSLNDLVNDPKKAVQKLADDVRAEGGEGDLPILPVAPGMGLQRSRRTTYRKGGSIRGERVPFSKRATGRQTDNKDTEDPPPLPPIDPAYGSSLAKVQSEPVAENYSRPTRSVRRQQNFSRETPAISPTGAEAALLDGQAQDDIESPVTPSSPPSSLPVLPVRTSSAAARNIPVPPVPPIPLIVETPPVPDTTSQPPVTFPERSSSQKSSQSLYDEQPQPPIDGPPARSSKRPSPGKPIPSPTSPTQASFGEQPNFREQPVKEKPVSNDNSNIGDMTSHPTPLPGSGGTTTANLTFIPTLNTAEERRSSERKSKDKDDTESIMSSKSSSGWKWFKSDDKERKKREKEEQARKAKGKTGDKSHDNARLDVLQSSIDTVVAKGRESLLIDRDSIDNKLYEERKKESNRKVSESKKEKDGFFGGLFGGSKKKGDKEPGHKKKEHRPLTPDPPPRQLRADVDYPWTRFPIIEERAIYRMAHIKLANPRRPLQSQVLLSNFMYSYLAKVQAMHPQLQVPISPQQKRQEEERKRREAEQAQLEQQQQQQREQQMAQQQGGQDGKFDFDYHRSGGQQYGDAGNQHDGSVQYVDDAQIYEYEHGVDQRQNDYGSSTQQNGNHRGHDGYSGPGQQGGGHGQQHGNGAGQNYYYGRDNHYDDDDDDENNDMW